jgi:hypothetical protein
MPTIRGSAFSFTCETRADDRRTRAMYRQREDHSPRACRWRQSLLERNRTSVTSADLFREFPDTMLTSYRYVEILLRIINCLVSPPRHQSK